MIPFVTAAHPNLRSTFEIVLELEKAGADIIEIGIPFSDPIADGPIIQASSHQALGQGCSMPDYLDLVRRIRSRSQVGLVFMSYLNPLLAHGLDRFEEEALTAGLDGVLVSDLTPEERNRLGVLQKIPTIFLAAPTSSDSRLEKIAAACRGFLYLVARTGVTGARTEVQDQVPAATARIRRFTRLPIAVGFGIRTRQDISKVWRYAQAAVIGSAIVQFIESHRQEKDLPARVGRFVADLIPERRPEA